jgi:hypothetical protein
VRFTDIVASSGRLAATGDDAGGGETLDVHDGTTKERHVGACRGRIVTPIGDEILATCDGPSETPPHGVCRER